MTNKYEVKEVKKYQAADGKEFSSLKRAEAHNSVLAADKLREQLKAEGYDLTLEEIGELVLKASEKGQKLSAVLRAVEKDGVPNEQTWLKMPAHIISQLTAKMLGLGQVPVKTIYVEKDEGSDTEHVLAMFVDDEYKSKEHFPEILRAYDYTGTTERETLTGNTLVHFYTKKLSRYDRAVKKLRANETLTEDEIEEILREGHEVYEEAEENRRWSQSVLTVVELDDGTTWAIVWERGLTELQGDEFYEQPYQVKVEQVEVTVMKTVVTPINK